jgi:hypothetical protein
MRDRKRADVEARAAEFNYSPGALYDWIAAYEREESLSSLGRKQRSDTGQKAIDELSKVLFPPHLNSSNQKISDFVLFTKK